MLEIHRQRIRDHIIEPLRSDRYTQGTGALERNLRDGSKEHCCLGVATREAIAAGCEVTVEEISPVAREYSHPTVTAFNGETDVLPITVAEWYGLARNPSLPDPNRDEWAGAAYLNDQRRYPFSTIADAFERLLEIREQDIRTGNDPSDTYE